MEPDGILIYGELDENNNLRTVVKELLTKARELKPKIWNQKIALCIPGPRINYDKIIEDAGNYGANEVIIISDDRYKEYNPIVYGELFKKTAEKFPPRILLFGATQQGKEIASYTAKHLRAGLTADCSDLDIGEYNLLLSERPTFGGQLNAQIMCKSFPQCATVREHTFKAVPERTEVKAIFNWIQPDESIRKPELIKKVKNGKKFRDLKDAKIIVSGGAGACRDNGFNLIYLLAQRLNAAVGGTREAVEKGYIPKDKQIGQTGLTVAPELYIAVGISGANQHLTAIKNSKKIIAINSDKNAPIFKMSDVGITGDLFEILPKLIEKIDIQSKENKEEQK